MAIGMLIILILVMVSWVYAFVKTDQILHSKYEQLIVTFQKSCKYILKMSLAEITEKPAYDGLKNQEGKEDLNLNFYLHQLE